VIVKFTKVTREHRSGVKRALLSRVVMYMREFGVEGDLLAADADQDAAAGFVDLFV
jgi:hypothetical protein